MDVNKTVLLFVVCLASGVMGCLRSSSQSDGDNSHSTTTPGSTTTQTEPTGSTWSCGPCGSPINVMLRVRNDLDDSNSPTFDVTQTVENANRQELLFFLMKAANQNTIFKFSATYYPAPYGMFIDSMNGVKNSFTIEPMAFWKLLYANGTALPLGVSNFIPENGDEIVFEYTRYVPGNYGDE